MTLNDHSQLNRLDLNNTMASQRRVSQPTSTPAPPSRLRHNLNGVRSHIQPITTYSQFTGGLHADMYAPIPEETFHASTGIPYPATSSYYANGYPLGPSFFQPANMAPNDGFSGDNNNRVGGWIKDVFGNDVYVGHGKIEEVNDDVELPTTPRAHGSVSSKLRTSQPASHELFGFHDEDNFLISTPPPPPRPRKLPSLRAHSTASEFLFHQTTAKNPTYPPPSLPSNAMDYLGGHAPPIPVVPDDPNEVHLVTQNIDLLEQSQEDVRFLGTLFASQSTDLDLSQHIDICARMEDHLDSIRESLSVRTRMGSEEWHVRSAAWNQKYFKRLNSIKITLQRLTRMTKLIDNNQSLRARQRQSILVKLEQHEAKLADLASKYTAAFDRLRLRHLHFLLTQSHSEARKAQKSRLASRASFENYWQCQKSHRAGLRGEFNELRQEIYGNNAPRADRQSSAL